jgi:hypothetical protein
MNRLHLTIATQLKRYFAFGLTVLAAMPHDSEATAPGCEASFAFPRQLVERLEGQFNAATTAFQGEVTAAEDLGSGQKLTFRILNSWKGPYQVGETLSLTVPVTDACAGVNCVLRFKIGDVTLLLSPTSAPSSLPGCWVHEGVVIQSVLSVPGVLMPRS